MGRSARQLAVLAIQKIEYSGGYSNIVLQNTDMQDLDNRDKGFITTLVYGVIERKLTLDDAILRYSSLKLSKITPEVLIILRLGVYQILFMDSVPDSAAVNESVKLVRAFKKSSASGFVNAVLRKVSKNRDSLISEYGKQAGSVNELSLKYSCPSVLVQKLVNDYGIEQTIQMLDASVGTPPTFIRANTLKVQPEKLVRMFSEKGVFAELSGSVYGAIKLSKAGEITSLPEYDNGLFHVEDLSAQMCCVALDAKPSHTVLDICSAPGGKTMTIAEHMENTGKIVACDVSENKLSLISDTAKRLGITIIDVMQNDGEVFCEKLPQADRILCDVPCSGIGVIRRRPELKYKDFSDLEDLYNKQFNILSVSSRYLKSDGILIYSTCTVNRAENERVVEKFLSENSDFEIVPFEGASSGMMTILPSSDGGDGFFICKIKKH